MTGGIKKLFIQSSSYISERIYNTCQHIKAQHRILVPPFIFIIEKIIHLHPPVQLWKYSELNTNIYVCCWLQFTAVAKLVTPVSAIPKVYFTFYKKLFYYLPANRAI